MGWFSNIVSEALPIAAGAFLGPEVLGLSAGLGGAAGGALGSLAQGGGLQGAVTGGLAGYLGGSALGAGMGALGGGQAAAPIVAGTWTMPYVAGTAGTAAGAAPSLGGSIGNLFGALGGSSSLLGTAGGLYGMYQSQQLGQLAKRLAAQQNPFDPYRAQYAQQLNALMANPSLVTQQPGYEAGLEAVQRSMAAQGYTGSGNMMTELAKYGGQAYQQALGNLSTLSGASAAPGAGASTAMMGGVGSTEALLSSLGLLAGGRSPIGYF